MGPADSKHLEVLFEDAHCLAVCKPAGLLTQGWSGGQESLEDRVRDYLQTSGEDAPYIGTIHRLDRPVSGVVLWAKTPKAARRMASQFADRSTIKQYRAIVVGAALGFLEDRWEDWLVESPEERGVQVVTSGDGDKRRPKLAITNVRPWSLPDLAEGCRGLILEPKTGRTHQLRVQAASRGWPIVGDSLYGSVRDFPEGIALHARSLTIRHPVQDRSITFVAPFPEAWRSVGGFDADSM